MFDVAVSGILKQLLVKRPFIGFDVILADGRLVKIDNAEAAWIEFDSELLYVVRLKPADEPMTEIISIRHIAMVRVPERLVPESKSDNPF